MIKKFVRTVFLIVCSLISVFPLYWMFTFSLKENKEIFGGNVIGLPHIWKMENYRAVIENTAVVKNFVNSMIVAVLTVIFTLLLSSMAAYALNRLVWKLSRFVYVLFLVGIMLPMHAVLLPLYRNLHSILNGYMALVIPYVAFQMPLTILILSGALQSFPLELEESAFIDGANIYKIFFRIIMPLMRPYLATTAILAWLASWNEFMLAVTFVTDSAHKTLTAGILELIGKYTTRWGEVGAGLTISVLPTLVIYISLSKSIQKSLVAGAIKG
ncbi:MAG: carbohydrate ABC transporter permease [Eubacteriales bacterium]|nr:carbohydrate ABC transporter permease [Eubacteriales bacterium]